MILHHHKPTRLQALIIPLRIILLQLRKVVFLRYPDFYPDHQLPMKQQLVRVGSVVLYVRLSSATTEAVTVTVGLKSPTTATATYGSDFVFTPSSSIVISAGETEAVAATLTIVGDTIAEGDETMIFTIQPTDTSIATSSGDFTATITDDD